MKKSRLTRFSLALGMVLSLSACGLMSNDGRFDPVDLTEYTPSVQGHITWTTSIGSGSGSGFAPVFADGDLFAATPDGAVIRVNANTGATVWRIKLSEELVGGVGVGEGLVTVSTRQGQMIALNASNGQTRWTSKSSTTVSSPALISQGLVVVRADDFRIQAFNAQTGDIAWSYLRKNPDMSLRTYSQVVQADQQHVFAPVPTGRLALLEMATGRLKWELVASHAKGQTDLDNVTDVVGKPLVQYGDVCFASYQGNVLCYGLTPQGPVVRWAQAFSTAVGVGGDQQTVIGAAIDGTVLAFSRQNGQTLWSDRTLANRALSNPVLIQDKVVVADYEAYAHFYDVKTGKLQGRLALGGGDSVVSPLLTIPQGVVAQTGNGNLVLFGAK